MKTLLRALAVLAFLFANLPRGLAADRPPNILFIIADQWRAQAFGFAGDTNVRTPNLDRLERECVNFTQAVAGMPVGVLVASLGRVPTAVSNESENPSPSLSGPVPTKGSSTVTETVAERVPLTGSVTFNVTV